jgi:hypothetical protein
MRIQRFNTSPSQLTPASFNADFSAVAHDQGLLNPSRTAWFDASLCLPTSRGLPSSTSVASKKRSVGPTFASHITAIIARAPRGARGSQWQRDQVASRATPEHRDANYYSKGCREFLHDDSKLDGRNNIIGRQASIAPVCRANLRARDQDQLAAPPPSTLRM